MLPLKSGCMVPNEGELVNKQTFNKESIIRFDMNALQSISTRTDFPYFQSKPIDFFDSEWIIYVYPNGFDEKTIGRVRSVLVGVSTANMKVEYALKPSAGKYVLLDSKEVSLSPSSPIEAITDGGGDTVHLFNKASIYLSTNGHFELKLTLKRIDDNNCCYSSNSSIFNGNVLRDRLFHKATSDVDIVVEGTRIPAHKLILSLASPVFTAMFENQMQESVSNEIVISDFSEEVVRSMLRCIYDSGAVDSEMVRSDQLLLIANKYELSELERTATDHIIRSITVDNAIAVLESADKFDRAQIKSAAIDFIISHAEQFFLMIDFAETLGTVLMNELLGYIIINKKRIN